MISTLPLISPFPLISQLPLISPFPLIPLYLWYPSYLWYPLSLSCPRYRWCSRFLWYPLSLLISPYPLMSSLPLISKLLSKSSWSSGRGSTVMGFFLGGCSLGSGRSSSSSSSLSRKPSMNWLVGSFSRAGIPSGRSSGWATWGVDRGQML